MLEKDIENIVAAHPEEIFPNEGFKLVGQQVVVEGRRLDILFEDRHGRKIIVEVKRGILTREASGQIAEYYGLLKNRGINEIYELILCANIIPKERKTFLETIGIDCRELGLALIADIAKKYDYTFADDKANFNDTEKEIKPRLPDVEVSDAISKVATSVWIFQGNPERYDILNALADKEIGNSIHWLINQHKNDIKKGHIALIWMSGKDSGIYAVARIETEPMMLDEPRAEKRYWLENEKCEAVNRVKLTILKRLINNPLPRKKLLKIPELSSLSILKQVQGTNFPVRDKEWNIISQLL